MLALETRSFEARFGTHCPFCGRSWGDPRPCGDSRADWSIRDGLRLLFSDRTSNCVVCDSQVQQGRKYCTACGLSVQRAKSRQSRHRLISLGQCEVCDGPIEVRSDKKGRGQTVCGRSCAMKRRHRKAA